MATKALFSECDDLLNICRYNVFKAVFARDSRDSRTALSRLVSAVISRELEVVDIRANEPAPEGAQDRLVRFDINCRAGDGEPIDVEMCLNPDKHEPVRLEFYAARLFVTQDIRGAGKSYKDLKRTYQIAILAEGTFFADAGFLHGFEYYDPARGLRTNTKGSLTTRARWSRRGGKARRSAQRKEMRNFWTSLPRATRWKILKGSLRSEAECGQAQPGNTVLG